MIHAETGQVYPYRNPYAYAIWYSTAPNAGQFLTPQAYAVWYAAYWRGRALPSAPSGTPPPLDPAELEAERLSVGSTDEANRQDYAWSGRWKCCPPILGLGGRTWRIGQNDVEGGQGGQLYLIG